MKKFFLIAVTLILCSQLSFAAKEGYTKGDLNIGPAIGYGWGIAIGADGEYAITDKQWVAIGAGGSLTYHLGYSEPYSWYTGTYPYYQWETGDIRYSAFSICAFGTYHLFPHKPFDLFAKVGLGYDIWFTTGAPSGYNSWAHSSGVGYISSVNLRYYFAPEMALKATVGWPMLIGVGIDFKFAMK